MTRNRFFAAHKVQGDAPLVKNNLLTIYSLLDLVLILHPHEDLKNVRLVDTEDADPEAGTADVQEAGNALAASKRQNTCRSKVPPSFTAKEQ